MTTTAAYAVLPYTTLTDSAGLPLTGGSVGFQDNLSRNPKNVYQDAELTTPYPNPLPLVNKGQVPPLYFEDDGNAYFVTAYDLNDNIIWTVPDFQPGVGGTSPTTQSDALANLIINGQFRFFESGIFSTLPHGTPLLVAPDNFYFFADGTGGTENISFQRFTLDNTDALSTPIYYLQYECTAAGSGETKKRVYYKIKDVRSLSNLPVTFSISAANFLGGDVSLGVTFIQYFGSGGGASPTVETPIGPFPITAEFDTNFVEFTPPSMLGKSIDGGDDYIAIAIDLPRNTTSQIGMTDWYLKQGANVVGFYPFQTYDQTLSQISGSDIPVPTLDQTYEVPTYIPTAGYNSGGAFEMAANPPTGSVMMWPTARTPYLPSWVLCNGQQLPKSGLSKRLFDVLGYDYTASATVDSFTSSAITSPVIGVTVTNTLTGASHSSPSAGTSPFTLTVITPGGSGVSEVVRIQTSPAAAIPAGSYFLIGNVGSTICIYGIRNGVGSQPTVSADFYAPYFYTGSEDATAISVIINALMNNLFYCVPNYLGVFLRGVSGGSGIFVDPGAGGRLARQDGATGNVVGTQQDQDLIAHSHRSPNNSNFVTEKAGADLGSGGFGLENAGSSSTQNSTYGAGIQNVPNNISVYYIIKL